MDVLFNTIDIRELFSAAESPSSPISAPDLRLLISRLDTHSLRIKSTVQSYLLSHQDDFSSLFLQCSDVVSKSEVLSSQVTTLLNLLCDNPIESDVGNVIGDIAEKRRELREKKEILELVCVILELDNKLGAVRDNVKSGRVVEASVGLRELKALLRVTGQDVDEGDPIVYGVLRKHWNESFEEIQDLLLRFMENALWFEQEENAVHFKYSATVNGIDLNLHSILKAMDVAGILEYGLAKFADLIIKHVIIPVVNCAAIPSFSEEIDQGLGDSPDSMLKMVSCVDPELKRIKVDGQAIYFNVVKIIEFLNKSLFFRNGTWMRCFGKLTWPRMSDQIIANFLSKVVPDDPSKLIEFQEIMKLTTAFEASLKEFMFISPFDKKDEKLSRFSDNIEVHFASRKKVQLLAKARDILLQANFSLSQDDIKRISGLNKEKIAEDFSNHVVLLFSSEKCVVSEAAKGVMELVHQILKNVCLLSPKVALEFYHTARNALVLYEAIVPVKLERQLDSINQAAVLIHNDCLYLSQEIFGLAFEYRPYFPSSLKEFAIFVDLAPRFQLMAEEVLQRQVQLVLYNLEQAIDGADGFQNTHQIKKFESAKFCIDQVSFIVEKIHIIWEPLMPSSIYERSMTMILKVIFFRVAKDILLLDDMAAEETLQLQRLIYLLFEHLSSMLGPFLGIDQRGKSSESQSDELNDLVLSVQKLRKLAELLDMPLKSITAAWESGELADCNFTLTEVEDFIRAIFTDTLLRKECLFRIERANVEARAPEKSLLNL